MRLIPSIEDEMRSIQTWELDDGRRVQLDARAAREHGAAHLLHQGGLAPDPAKMERKPVYYDGRLAGTVPADFHPGAIRSTSFLYDARPGDFTPHLDGWKAAKTLGPGDLEAVAGFLPSPEPECSR